MNEIRCPMCGKPNPDDREECRYCGARLIPLVASQAPEEAEYRPPPVPTEPEPPAEEPAAPPAGPPPPAASPGAPAPQDDWLSALRHEGDEDDDSSFGDTGELHMDDDEEDAESAGWLSRIEGEEEEAPAPTEDYLSAPAQPGGLQPDPEPSAEEGLPDWLESGLEPEDTAGEKAPDRRPDWDAEPGFEDVPSDALETRDIPGLSFREEAGPAQPPDDSSEGDVPDWLKQIRSEAPSDQPVPGEETPAPAAAESTPEPAPEPEDLPEWLTRPGGDQEEAGIPPDGLETRDIPGPSFPAEPQAADEPPPAEPADVPDWLQNLEPPRPPAPEPPVPEEESPGGLDTQEIPTLAFEADQEESPEWLKGIDDGTGQPPEAPEPAAAVPPTDLPDWMTQEGLPAEGLETRDIPGLSFREEAGPPGEEPPAAGDVPDWLEQPEPPGEGEAEPAVPPEQEMGAELPADEAGAAPAELPDWLAEQVPTDAVETLDIPGLSGDEEAEAAAPDWLRGVDTPASEETAALEGAAAAAGFPQPGSFDDLEGETPEETEQPWSPAQAEPEAADDVPSEAFETKDLSGMAFDEEGVVERADTPEWLKEVKSERIGARPEAEDAEEPEWMEAGETDREGPVSMGREDLPAWLRGLQEVQEEAISDVEDELLEDIDSPVAETPEEELPGWLAELRAKTGAEAAGVEETEPPSPAEPDIETQPEEEVITPGELPNWVSQMRQEAGKPESAAEEPELEPAELPGWLRAMRPVDAVEPAGTPGAGAGQDMEGVGPLAGLSGILPAEPEITQTGTPATFSMRVGVSKSQYDHVALLKELIKDEAEVEPQTRPEPIIQTHHILRWAIALVLILAVGIPALAGLESTPGPELVPPETLAVGNLVGSLTQGRTVLVSFDYQPGLSAEMEAAGAAMIDHLMLLGTPMTLVSTSPTGPALAERFFASAPELRAHGYTHGEQYVNLGYIPGGAAGLLNFALSPRRIFPIPFNLAGLPEGSNVWATPPLQGVQQLSDFEMVVVLTDDLNSARAWIEQVEPLLGQTPLVLITSAQTSPLLMPYYENDTPQVEGLISGVPGGMTYERLTGRSGQARRYWDAFNNGLMLVNLLILVGGALSVGLFLIRLREPVVPEESA